MPRQTKDQLEMLVTSLRSQISQSEIISARIHAEADSIRTERDKLLKENQWLRMLIQSHMEILQRSTIKER